MSTEENEVKESSTECRNLDEEEENSDENSKESNSEVSTPKKKAIPRKVRKTAKKETTEENSSEASQPKKEVAGRRGRKVAKKANTGTVDESNSQDSTIENKKNIKQPVAKKRKVTAKTKKFDNDDLSSCSEASSLGSEKPAVKSKKTKQSNNTNSSNFDGSVIVRLKRFFQESNRPYSIADVLVHFRNEISKSVMTKYLQSIVDENVIYMKLNGKTPIYCAIQKDADPIIKEEVEKEIEKLEVETKLLKNEVDILKIKYSKLNEYPCDEKLKEETEAMEAEIKRKEEKYKNVKLVDKKEMEKARTDFKKMNSLLKKRIAQFNDIVNGICEGMGKKKSALFEELGFEN